MRLLALLALMTTASGNASEYVTERADWGNLGDRQVSLFTISNPGGAILRMTDYGAKIVELHVPDRDGNLGDVVLGFDNLDQYIGPSQSIGATIGRYANRIRDGRFVIDGVVYELTKNEGPNTIHGAGEFENVVWDTEFIATDLGEGLRFRYSSPDGTHGFPGNLDSTVTYVLTPDNAIHITFEAVTDEATHVNMTQHSYFNLNGASETIHDHVAMIRASKYLVFDEVVATGEIASLNGQPWDLREPTRLGDMMDQIPLGGYHHDYVVEKQEGDLALVAEVVDASSGRTLTVSSTQPNVTFYAAMGLTVDLVGKYGITYGPYMAFCLETQHPVDAANHPQFASTLLRPGETYQETVIYDFGIE